MVELFSHKRGANLFMKCLFTEVHQLYQTKNLSITKIHLPKILLYLCDIENPNICNARKIKEKQIGIFEKS